jgi:DNA-binding transcriptional LysR family regulator
LGSTLFERSARGYRVRAGGVQIIDAVRAVAKAVSAVERMAAGREVDLSGTVRLTSTDTICHSILPRHIAAFRAAYPEIMIDVSATNARLNLSKLDADITIRPAMRLPDELRGVAVNRIDLRIFGSPHYLSNHSQTRHTDHRWLAPSGALCASPIGQWAETLSADHIVGRADSYLILARMAQAGMGLAMLPVCIGDAWDGLVRADLPVEFSFNVWVASHPDLADTPHIRTTLRFFEDALRAEEQFLA